MPFRFIIKSIHTYLIDYPVAIILMVAPFRLNLSKSSPVALWLSAVPRITALLLPAFTDHATGLLRVIRYWPHLWVDRALGVDSITAPSAFHFTGLVLLVSRCWALADDLSSHRARGARRPASEPRHADYHLRIGSILARHPVADLIARKMCRADRG